MHYDIDIVEYPDNDLIDFAVVDDGVYFRQNNFLRQIDGNDSKIIFELEGLSEIISSPSGLWLLTDKKSIFFDCLKNKPTDLVFDFPISKAVFVNNKAIFVDYENDCDLTIVDVDTKIIKTHNSSLGYIDACSSHIIFHDSISNILICYDYNFSVVWQKKFLKKAFKSYSSNICLYKESIIVNVGVDEVEIKKGMLSKLERINFQITSYNIINGEEIWSREFSSEPSCSQLLNDRVYICVDELLIILDANTGEVVLDNNMDFINKPIKEGSFSFFENENNILLFDAAEHVIKIFTHQMESIQEIFLPKPDTEHGFGFFSPNNFKEKVLGGGSIYAFLDYYTGLASILILKSSQSSQPEISVKPRANFNLKILSEEDGSNTYHLSIKSKVFDEVLTGGEYELLEICQYYGIDRSEHNHFDPKFNGKVIYFVSMDDLPTDAEMKLQNMINRVIVFLETFLVTPPSKNKVFDIDLKIL